MFNDFEDTPSKISSGYKGGPSTCLQTTVGASIEMSRKLTIRENVVERVLKENENSLLSRF